MTQFTFHMSEEQAQRVHDLASSHLFALKNWIASAVECGKDDRAREMVGELRAYEAIFAGFNVKSARDIAEHTGKPLEVTRTVRNFSR